MHFVKRRCTHLEIFCSCEFGNEVCNEEDFEETLTDFGLCYTFNGPNVTRRRQITEKG